MRAGLRTVRPKIHCRGDSGVATVQQLRGHPPGWPASAPAAVIRSTDRHFASHGGTSARCSARRTSCADACSSRQTHDRVSAILRACTEKDPGGCGRRPHCLTSPSVQMHADRDAKYVLCASKAANIAHASTVRFARLARIAPARAFTGPTLMTPAALPYRQDIGAQHGAPSVRGYTPVSKPRRNTLVPSRDP